MYSTQVNVDYTALRNIYWQVVPFDLQDHLFRVRLFDSCMQPPGAHKPIGIASREGSKHHDDRDTSSGYLHQFPGTRKQGRTPGPGSNTAMAACVIHATVFVVLS